MEFTCYYLENEDDQMVYTVAFAFMRLDDIIFVDVFFITYINGEFEENICKFYMNCIDIAKHEMLFNFYKLSLILTENSKKLVYKNDVKDFFIDFNWRIKCRQHYGGNCFSDKYEYNFGYIIHPIIHPYYKLEHIYNKKNKEINENAIKYYKIYENLLSKVNCINLYINGEIEKIDKELINVEKNVCKDVLYQNANILNEVLPSDIVNSIICYLDIK